MPQTQHTSPQYYGECHWAVWSKKRPCNVSATDPHSAVPSTVGFPEKVVSTQLLLSNISRS